MVVVVVVVDMITVIDKVAILKNDDQTIGIDGANKRFLSYDTKSQLGEKAKAKTYSHSNRTAKYRKTTTLQVKLTVLTLCQRFFFFYLSYFEVCFEQRHHACFFTYAVNCEIL